METTESSAEAKDVAAPAAAVAAPAAAVAAPAAAPAPSEHATTVVGSPQKDGGDGAPTVVSADDESYGHDATSIEYAKLLLSLSSVGISTNAAEQDQSEAIPDEPAVVAARKEDVVAESRENAAVVEKENAAVAEKKNAAVAEKDIAAVVEKEIVVAVEANAGKNAAGDSADAKPGEAAVNRVTDPDSEEVDIKYESALEFIENEDECDLKEKNRDSNDQGSAGESCGGESDDVNDLGEDENAEPAASGPVLPVPVDDDTNDPQYIPRRGRFYEHDDRMAYSTTSSEGSESEGNEEISGEENEEGSDRHRGRRRRTDSQKPKSTTVSVDGTENISSPADGTSSSRKVLAISKVVSEKSTDNASVKKPVGGGFRKTRDIDAINKWTHDMYDENQQTRKSRDELMASYGYDIREESEAPRARRHHKYGRAATAKYTRNWQDTKAYTGAGSGPQSSKVKRGGITKPNVGGPNKNKNKSTPADEYTSEYPSLDGTKTTESPSTTTDAPTEKPTVTEESGQSQKPKSAVHQEKKIVPAATSNLNRHQPAPPRSSIKSHSSHQDQQNGVPQPSTHNKNFFQRPSADVPVGKEKGGHANRDYPTPVNSNLFNRRPQNSGANNQHNNFKQNFNNHNQHSPSSSSRGRSFHQHHNNQQQFNRDRYFAKGSGPPSNSNYDHHHNSSAPATAGTGRTRHGAGNYYNNRHYDRENEQNEQPLLPPQPVVRSSKRYTVQSRRELPDPVLNFGGMTKPTQPPVSQHQQNGMVIQEQPPQQSIQMHQPQPQLQIQQYHQPIQQIHHGMVLDHNTGLMVMATADPVYHQLYAPPQYATAVTPGASTNSAEDPNAAAVAIQLLAAQGVYQPLPVPTGVTASTTGTQSLQPQQPETFMTTYYQPQQQPQQQPPPRRVNLAIPIVAPPSEPIQQQGTLKTNLSPTPPPTAASTN